MADTAELRVDMPKEEFAVLDGYCNGTGKNRSEVVRALIRDWSEKKFREASSIVRVAGGNPTFPEGLRTPNGKPRFPNGED